MTHKLAVASAVHGHKIRHKSASGACCVDRQHINVQTCHADSSSSSKALEPKRGTVLKCWEPCKTLQP